MVSREVLTDASRQHSEAPGVEIDEDIHFDVAMLMVKKLYQEEQSESPPFPIL